MRSGQQPLIALQCRQQVITSCRGHGQHQYGGAIIIPITTIISSSSSPARRYNNGPFAFPIDWHLNLENLIFERFAQKLVIQIHTFYPKKGSILAETRKVTVLTWNAIPCRTRNKIPNRLVFKPGKLNF